MLIFNVRITFDALHMILGHTLFWVLRLQELPKFETKPCMVKFLNFKTMHMCGNWEMTILPLYVGPLDLYGYTWTNHEWIFFDVFSLSRIHFLLHTNWEDWFVRYQNCLMINKKKKKQKLISSPYFISLI